MKNKLLYFFLLGACLSTSIHAENNKTAMTKEDFIKMIMQQEQSKKEAVVKTIVIT